MDGSVLWRAALLQALTLGVVALAAGRARWTGSSSSRGAGSPGRERGRRARCSPARCCGCRCSPVLAGAALAGLPSLISVLIGVHWLGAPFAVAIFACLVRPARARQRRDGWRWPDGSRAAGQGRARHRRARRASAAGSPKALAAEGVTVALTSRSARARRGGRRRDRRARLRVRLRRPRRDRRRCSTPSRPTSARSTSTSPTPAARPPATRSAFTREQWEAAQRTLLISPMTIIERVLPGMRERGFGRVVAIGSMAVREPIDALQLSNAHRPGPRRRLQGARAPGRRATA